MRLFLKAFRNSNFTYANKSKNGDQSHQNCRKFAFNHLLYLILNTQIRICVVNRESILLALFRTYLLSGEKRFPNTLFRIGRLVLDSLRPKLIFLSIREGFMHFRFGQPGVVCSTSVLKFNLRIVQLLLHLFCFACRASRLLYFSM